MAIIPDKRDPLGWVLVRPVIPLEQTPPVQTATQLVLQACGGMSPISVERHLGCCASDEEMGETTCGLHPDLDGLEMWCTTCEEALIMDRDGRPNAVRVDGQEYTWQGDPDMEMFVLLHCHCGRSATIH